MITIRADRANARTVNTQLLTSGMVGVQVKFVFSNEWEGLRKTAVFQVGDKSIDVLDSQWDDNICTIPSECLATSGKTITVGLYGYNDAGDLVIPTVYAKIGSVRVGADPSGDESTSSTLPVYEQIRGSIGELSDLTTADKTNLVAAINEAVMSGGSENSVLYISQELTDEQKTQARINIGAIDSSEIPPQSIPKIESLDKTNVKFLRDLEDGTYILQGYFKPYTGANSSFVFSTGALVTVSNSSTATHVQIFEPYNNQIQHLNITDTTCDKTYVFLNKIGNLSALKTTAKDTIVDAINETASTIPAVTASDNGKFLQVVDGAWTAGTGSSSDVSLGITEAYKGYGIRVKAIDENNRPTEWEAVDELPIPLHMGDSDGTIIRFCAVPVETLTPTSAYELAKSCLKSANTKLWYPEGPLNSLISDKPAALVLTVSEDDTNIYAWYISKDGTVKSVATPKSIFTATE